MNKLRRLFSPFVIALCLGVNFGLVTAPPARAATLDLSRYKGKVVYLDFWASWCGPCKESFPWLMQLQGSYSHKDFAVIAVNLDHDRAKAEDFLQQVGSDLKVVYDPKGKLAEKYHVKGMPSAVVIGRDGRVHYHHTGFYQNETAKYENQVAELISEK